MLKVRVNTLLYTNVVSTLYTVPLGFLAQGESPERFEDWLHSHRLLVLSRQHNWGPAALG